MTRNTNKKEKLSDKNEEWYNERMDVFDLYWDDKIDLETFKEKIAEVDFKYKNPDEYRIKQIVETKTKIEELEEYKELHKDVIEEYERLKEDKKNDA